MSYTAGSLNIELLGVSESAIKSITRTTSALRSLSKVINQINQSNLSLDKKLNIGNIGGKVKNIGNIGNTFAKAGKGIKNMLNISKWYAVYYLARRLGNAVANIVKAGSDYTETLNLWQVAMRDNLNTATNFVNKMNEAYGISEKTLMNAQATFKNMIGSLGQIPESVAYSISEAVTLMAVDYSSLYNVTMENAVQKFQSALAGQVRPIRTVSGYDITETTIYQLYQSIGGQKTMRQLNRTEKQLLSIYAVFEQMGRSGALGDMTKTIENYANQSRMVKENWVEFTTWLGVSLQYLLQNSGTMQKINALLITASETARAFAYYLGYTDPNFAFSWADGVEETNEQIDELTGKLAGFDKFRSLSGGQESPLAIDQKLLSALSGYTSLIDKTTNEARELANTWLKILGLQYNSTKGIWEIVNEDTGLVKTFNILKDLFQMLFGDEMKSVFMTSLKEIIPILGTILVVITKLISALVPLVKYIINFINQYLPKISPIIETIGEILQEVVDVVYNITLGSESVSEGIFTVIDALQTVLNAIKNIFLVIKPIVNFILDRFGFIFDLIGLGFERLSNGTQAIAKIISAILQGLSFIVSLIKPIISFVIMPVTKLLEGVALLIEAIYDTMRKIINLDFKSIGNTWKDFGKGIVNIFSKEGWSASAMDVVNATSNDFGYVFGGTVITNDTQPKSGYAVNSIGQATYGAYSTYASNNKQTNQPVEIYFDGELMYEVVTEHANKRGEHWGQ